MAAAALILAVAGLGARPAELTGGDRLAYAARVEQAARLVADHARGGPCPAAQVVSHGGAPLAPGALEREAIRAEGVSTAWLELAVVNGCGRSIQAKTYMLRTLKGLDTVSLPPGTGAAGYRLARDAQRGALEAVLKRPPPPACSRDEQLRTLRLADTALTSAYAPHRPWTERWTYMVCGRPRSADLAFTPQADGETRWAVPPPR